MYADVQNENGSRRNLYKIVPSLFWCLDKISVKNNGHVFVFVRRTYLLFINVWWYIITYVIQFQHILEYMFFCICRDSAACLIADFDDNTIFGVFSSNAYAHAMFYTPLPRCNWLTLLQVTIRLILTKKSSNNSCLQSRFKCFLGTRLNRHRD